MRAKRTALVAASVFFGLIIAQFEGLAHELRRAGNNLIFVKIQTQLGNAGKAERDKVSSLGIAIDAVRSDSVFATVTRKDMIAIQKAGLKVLEFSPLPEKLVLDFPEEDSVYHNYAELTTELQAMVDAHPKIASKYSIGKTLKGKDIWCVQVGTKAHMGMRPGVFFVGNHHAREHLSAEIPLLVLKYLLDNYETDNYVRSLVDNREIYFVPMLNVDGAEYDIASGRYRSHRKNMRETKSGFWGSKGVDLNRNYGFGWGGEGSSKDPSSEIYRGPEAFSEPETRAVRDFLLANRNIKTLLSFHTFSELVIWPWGYKDDVIAKSDDRSVFEKMGKQMASWNNYTPMKSSELYLGSGDTTDWAYGELGIFAFTFELSPSRENVVGGFYPGPDAIASTFAANLRPTLYLIDVADNPYKVLQPNNFVAENVEAATPIISALRKK